MLSRGLYLALWLRREAWGQGCCLYKVFSSWEKLGGLSGQPGGTYGACSLTIASQVANQVNLKDDARDLTTTLPWQSQGSYSYSKPAQWTGVASDEQDYASRTQAGACQPSIRLSVGCGWVRAVLARAWRLRKSGRELFVAQALMQTCTIT